jgi:hypothetical protein
MRYLFVILAVFTCVAPLAQTQGPRDATACAALAGTAISSSLIALPTTGAMIDAALVIPATDQKVENNQVVLATPEYCEVKGHISPVDPTAPPINFQVNLPSNWNHKAAQMGGSGLNGSIPVSLTTGMQWGPESIPPDAPYALSRGFAVFGSDSGHQGGFGRGRGGDATSPAPDWTMNKEALTNFAYAQLKKTHDVAVELMRRRYGAAPRLTYFFGSSQGGREALMAVQRFPQDYDGVFVQVPVFPQLYWLTFDPLFRTKQQAGPGWIPPAKVSIIGREVLRQCDALDGISDGLVSNYMACNKKFDPATSPNAWSAMRCEGGADSGETCFSDDQIKSIQAVYGRMKLPFPFYKGWDSYPGWTTGGESPMNWKALNAQPSDSTNVQWLKTVIADDPSVTPLNFDLEKYRARIQELSALLDAQDPDLSAFRRRGGKLIWKVNSTDYTADPRWSYDYYDKIVATMGQRTVNSFIRFYVAIGIFHNRNVGRNPLTNAPVPNYIDFIGMLDDWVSKGKAPADTQVLVDMPTAPPFTVRASFPMCRYPKYPKYSGHADPKQASSYVCTK